ncbi:MAG: YabP/YqfC family sporulation protein [Oscillospiraceae bacterium]|nr:YabP/YqfC family sporulation protein [Oscillospiraceae bacterium]
MEERRDGRMVLEGRSRLTLTGAKEVLRFDEELAELSTSLGDLTVEGTNLKLKCLSLDTGTVVVEGELRSFSYEEPKPRRGWRR